MQTVKDLIKVLPFTPEFKEELLGKYESLSDDQKLGVIEALWKLYDAVYEARLDENMDGAFARAGKNEEKLDDQFYARVKQATDMQFNQNVSDTETAVDLTSARAELEKILDKVN